jgi:MFS family permease
VSRVVPQGASGANDLGPTRDPDRYKAQQPLRLPVTRGKGQNRVPATLRGVTASPSRAPGTGRRVSRLVLVLSIIARMPQGLAPLAVVLLAQERTGSIAAAGLAGGAWAVGSAVSQPVWGGFAGRGRAHRVEAATALSQGLVLLLLAFGVGGSEPALVLLAAVGGLLSAPTSPISRTLWPELAEDQKDLDALYALDATWQEMVFIAGPALVGVLVAVSGPGAALTAAASCGAAGGLIFAWVVRPLWQPYHPAAHRISLAAALARLMGPYAALCVMALGLGLVEVGVPAAAILEQNRAASGWLLALWSLGSLIGGLVASRVTWRRGPAQRWPGLLAGVTVGTATIVVGWTFGLGWLGFTLFLSGLALAPSLAAGYGVIGERAAPGRRTDAFAWTTTFLLLGFGGGAAIGGVLADISPTWAFAAGTVVTALAVGIASLSARH